VAVAADVDLPNDLLDIFEEGEYVIPELARVAATQESVKVTADDDSPAVIRKGRVRCEEFPLVIITSNGEREFPAPFMRRRLPRSVGQAMSSSASTANGSRRASAGSSRRHPAMKPNWRSSAC
jgi:MoxR-like ATPase